MKRIADVGLLLLCQVPLALGAQVESAQVVYPSPVLQVGEVMGDSDAYAFTEIRALAVVGDSILVLEGGSNEIRIFDHRGRFLGRIGGKGDGPGEFRYPTDVNVVSQEIVVSDPLLHRQSFFSLDGELLRTEHLGQLSGQSIARLAPMRGGLTAAETLVEISVEGAYPEQLVALMHPQDTGVDTLARYSSGNVPYWTATSYGFLGHEPGSEGRWAVAGDSILAIVSGEPPVLRWWESIENGFSLQPDIALPLHPEAFTSDDKGALVDKVNQQRLSRGSPPLPKAVRVHVPAYWGQVKRLVLSNDHKCWVQWDQPRTDNDFDWFLIDLARRDLRQVRLPAGFEMLAAVDDRLYGFVLSDLDTPSLTVFRLREDRRR